MSVTETLAALGSWSLNLSDQAPDEVLARLGYFGHVALIEGPVDVAAAGDGLLSAARYVGVCRERPSRGRTIGGSGMVFWLGDEDGKGHVVEAPLTLATATLVQAVTAALPPTVTVGTIHPQVDPAARYSGTHQFQAPREVLQIICDAFGVELRVNGDATVDVGTAAQLYNTEQPDTVVVRRGAGADVDLTGVGGEYETDEDVFDYSTRVLLLGQKIGVGDEPDQVFATGSANATTVPYKDLRGGTVKLTRLISESGQTEGSAAARAQLQLNRFNRVSRALTVTAEEYETRGGFVVGDATHVYDPEAGIVDHTKQLLFRGQLIFPAIERVTSRTWPILEGLTVAFRTHDGAWLDLTPWVVWEADSTSDLVVGDLPRSLTSPGNAIQDRLDAIGSASKTPKTPAGLTLATSSTVTSTGADASTISATWMPVTQNTDDTSVALSHYEVRYRPTFRAPLWQASALTSDTDVDLGVVAGLRYDVSVRAVSTAGTPSGWSSGASIIAATDGVAPAAPSDPVVTSYLGQLRIAWDGLSNVGATMPTDFNRVDVHVGTTAGFTASSATLVSSLSTAGVAYATAPYGSPRYVRLIAIDHTGNASPSSGVVAGSTVQVGDGDIAALSVGKLTSGTVNADVVMAGRFATALTGNRRELNAIGFQAWDASNALTISLDGVNNLLTGRFRTALTGRRVEIGAAGSSGEIALIAPDGATTKVQSYTSSLPNAGIECLSLRVPIADTYGAWNTFQMQNNERAYLLTRSVSVNYGGDPTSGSFRVEHARTRGTPTTPPILDPRIVIDENNGTIIYDNGNRLRMWLSNDGGFQLWDGDDVNNAGDQRIVIANDYTAIYHPAGPNNTENRPSFVAYRDQTVLFGAPAAAGDSSFLGLIGAGVPGASSRLKFVNRNGFGGLLKYYYLASDVSGERFEIRTVNDTGFIPLWASAFVVNSDRAAKDDIRDLDFAAMDKLRTLKPRLYSRKSAEGIPDLEQLGFVTDEMPAELVTGDPASDDSTGIDVMALLATVVSSVQSLDGRLSALEMGAKK